MAHRGVAVLILLAVCAAAFRSFTHTLARPAAFWCGVWLIMIFAQVVLGAWTIWSNKAADVATFHMALGALSLFFGVIFSFRLPRGCQTARFVIPDHAASESFSRTA
jgi:cytochrome c oxidase assembly protein subunit 15